MSKRNRSAFFTGGLVAGFLLGTALALIFLVWAVPDFRDPTFSKNQYDQLQAAAPSDYQHDNQNTHFWIREFYGWVYAEDSLAQWIMSLVAVAATIVSLLALV